MECKNCGREIDWRIQCPRCGRNNMDVVTPQNKKKKKKKKKMRYIR